MTEEEYHKELCKKSTQEQLRQFVSTKIKGTHQVNDIIQETNYKLILKFPEYKHENKFISWVCTVGYWTIRAFQKKSALSKITYDSELIDSLSKFIEDKKQRKNFDLNILRNEIGVLIRGYDDDKKEIIKLLGKGLKAREVQEETGFDISLIYQTKQKIKKDFKKQIEVNKVLQEYLL
jgi:RNA polymerase sigma factor (sigma-70 family)